MSVFERPRGSGKFVAKFSYRKRQRWVPGGPWKTKEDAVSAELRYRHKLKSMVRVGRERVEAAEVLPHTLYRYYSEDHELLYVGITGTAWRRVSEHRKEREWWPLVAYAEFEHFDGYSAAAAAEAEQIKSLLPIYNARGNPAATRKRGSS